MCTRGGPKDIFDENPLSIKNYLKKFKFAYNEFNFYTFGGFWRFIIFLKSGEEKN